MSLSAHRGPAAVVVAVVATAVLAGCGASPPGSVTGPPAGRTPGSSQAGVVAPALAPKRAPSVKPAPLVKPAPPSKVTKPGNRVQVAGAVPVSVSPPVSIKIPAMFIDQPLVGLRVNRSDGSLTPPDGWNDIGWWSAGPAPGAAGAAVIAGHVDSKTGPAVFAGLGSLKAGSKIVIDRADGSVATYAVYQTSYFDRDHFPSDVVYRQKGSSELHLLTCAGQWERGAQHYAQNYVVFAKIVHDTMRAS